MRLNRGRGKGEICTNLFGLDKKLLLAPVGHMNRLLEDCKLLNRFELCLLCKEVNGLWKNLFFIYICNCFLICVSDQVLWRWIIGHLAIVDCIYSVSHVWGQRILGKECYSKRKGNVLLYEEIAHEQSNEMKSPFEMVEVTFL